MEKIVKMAAQTITEIPTLHGDKAKAFHERVQNPKEVEITKRQLDLFKSIRLSKQSKKSKN